MIIVTGSVVHQDIENPARLFFFEEWADEAALAAHFAVPASGVFVKALGTLVAEPPKPAVYLAQKR